VYLLSKVQRLENYATQRLHFLTWATVQSQSCRVVLELALVLVLELVVVLVLQLVLVLAWSLKVI
jgi:hypothetical protein